MTPSYAAIMAAAIGTGYLLSRRTQSQLGLTGEQRLAVAIGAVCGGIIAARLPYVVGDWHGLASGTAWFDSGKTILFGLVGGYFGVEAAKWATGVRIKTGDSFAVPVAVAIGIGRLACYSAGCCFGTATTLPWGVDFGDGFLRHPTQIYETVFHLSAALVLAWLSRHGLLRGQLIKAYFIAYFVYRFATEFIRPEPKLLLGLTAYQWAALMFIPMFIMLWAIDSGRLKLNAPQPSSESR